jgi:hypothetical protein
VVGGRLEISISECHGFHRLGDGQSSPGLYGNGRGRPLMRVRFDGYAVERSWSCANWLAFAILVVRGSNFVQYFGDFA